MKNKKTVIVLVGFFILLSAAFMTYFYSLNKIERQLPYYGEGEHKVRAFSFVNQLGDTITEKNTAGKVYVAEYFFATCEGICPKMNENLNKVYQQFKGNPDVLFLSHTVDPEEDSAAALNSYGLQFEADPKQWMFLTGDKKALYDQARYSYLINAEDTNTSLTIDKDFIHDNHFVLVDQNGRLRGIYDGLLAPDMVKLAADIKVLLKIK